MQLLEGVVVREVAVEYPQVPQVLKGNRELLQFLVAVEAMEILTLDETVGGVALLPDREDLVALQVVAEGLDLTAPLEQAGVGVALDLRFPQEHREHKEMQ